jgi:competence protein ComEC
MLSVVALALWSGRLTSVSHVLSAALGVVLLLDPWAVLAPGFWLSFGAVAMILYASVGRTAARPARRRADEPPPAWQQRWKTQGEALLLPALRTQYVVTLGLAPMTLLLFAQISLVSPLANAVAIPLVSFVVTPLALVGSLLPAPLSTWLLVLAHGAVEQLAALLAWLGSARLAVWAAPIPSPLPFGFAMLGTAWLLAPRGWPARWAGAAAWLPALSAVPETPPLDTFTATVFDVGQGMAVLVETAHHRLLYDAGPWYSPESNGGNRVIVPYLKARGIGALDALVISHSDADHAGGAPAVLDALPISLMLSSLPSAHALVRQAGEIARPCVAGQRWLWDGVSFEMLHPTRASYAMPGLKSNARSCTLRIRSGGARPRTLLAAGDIEAAQEAQLVETSEAALPADVLLAPHHGSGTSSTLAFLRAVHPALAVFQVGYRNRYHHPKASVWERYGDAGIARLRTDETGAVTLHFSEVVTADSYRSSHPRYWYGR